MECEDKNGNPWALFNVESKPTRKTTEIIDNRFPNNFKKSSSVVVCNICQVLLLKSQTLYHFKCLHTKKLDKKRSKCLIPYDAIKYYDMMSEHKTKKQNGITKNVDLFHLNRSKFELRKKEKQSKVALKVEKKKNSPQKKVMPIKIETVDKTKLGMKLCKQNKPDGKNRSIANDLKLNIKLNPNGTISSSLKTGEGNIFDRMSNLCSDQSPDGKVVVKQTDQSYGCTVITDEHNNSILIDNDRDDCDDCDCCDSSLSNDSAYYSLPNNSLNVTSTAYARPTKVINYHDASVAPPLVTAYQYQSNGANTISYHANVTVDNNNSNKGSMVTRNVSRDSVISLVSPTTTVSSSVAAVTKSNVKHRFYVSSHSNRNMLNSIRRTASVNKSFTNDNNFDFSYSMPSENRDMSNYGDKSNSCLNQQQTFTNSLISDDRNISIISLNSCNNREFSRRSLVNSNYWDCIQEKGYKNNLFIPKWLSWKFMTSRCKAIPHLYKNQKYSPDIIVPQASFNSVISHSSISDNPLLTSYTVEPNGSDNLLESPDQINTSGILLDYPFPDRNQMSFQQRLLERGVISQRDIARSQRCLSMSNQTLMRKNVKSNSNKQVLMDTKRMMTNKSTSIKNHTISQNGPDSVSQFIVNKSNHNYKDPSISDIAKNRSTIFVNNNFDLMPVSVLCNQRSSWHDNVKLPRMPSTNANMSTFQGICLSQNYKSNKLNGTIVMGPDSGFNTILSQIDEKSEPLLSSFKFQSNSPFIQIGKNPFNSGMSAQNMLPTECEFINHNMNNSINCFNGCSQNFVNHSTNVIHTNFDR